MLDKPLHTPGFPHSDCVSPGLLLHKQREDYKSALLCKALLPTALCLLLAKSSSLCLLLLPHSELLRLWFPPALPKASCTGSLAETIQALVLMQAPWYLLLL